MGVEPYAFWAIGCLSVLATALSVLALRVAATAVTASDVAALQESARAQVAMWEQACKGLQREVSHELDRLETKRRSAAAIESKLRARENGDELVDQANGQQQQQPNVEDLDRAQLRALRRMGQAT